MVLQDRSKNFRRDLCIALLQGLLAGGQHARDIVLHLAAKEAVDNSAHSALRLSPHKAIERATVAESIDRGQRLHEELPGNRWVLIDVDLLELDLAGVALDHLLEDGRQLLARLAPGRPEIDEIGDRARSFEHI